MSNLFEYEINSQAIVDSTRNIIVIDLPAGDDNEKAIKELFEELIKRGYQCQLMN